MSTERKRLLIFSPAQSILPHAFTERAFAEELSKDFEISFLGCRGIFSRHCLAMDAENLDFYSDKKQKVCRDCKAARSDTWKGMPQYFIDDGVSPDELAEIDRFVSGAKDVKIKDLIWKGFSVGRMATYELILSKKISDIELITEEQREMFFNYLRNTLITLTAYTNLLSKQKWDGVLLYNTNYGINHAVYEISRRQGIRTWMIHGSVEFDRIFSAMYLTDKKPETYLRERIKYFEENVSQICIDSRGYKRILAHVDYALRAKSFWIYSKGRSEAPSFSALEMLNLDPQRPTALLSLASTDEIYATDFSLMNSNYISSGFRLFPNQTEMIAGFLEFFSKNPDWQLIIRVHPREFPNQREKVTSRSAILMKEALKNLPENVRLNLPEDGISIYNLFDEIHLHVTSWSSTGLESSLFGIPTICTTRGYSLYSNAFVSDVPPNRKDLELKMSSVLGAKFSRDYRRVFRASTWLLFDFNETVVQFEDENFWNIQHSMPKRIHRKLRKILGYPSRSFSDYFKGFSISEDQRNILHQSFLTQEPVHELMQRDQQKKTRPNVDSPEFRDFLQALSMRLGGRTGPLLRQSFAQRTEDSFKAPLAQELPSISPTY